ncbi:MAG: hypothetical protein JRI23_34030 [Deltaproteobacteria bacterium]|jgi:hypothetical protein|nr:hypothetical protein [Deltaproteobacteria bacterium]MBW2537312.1 hypothetical protein [Deltaproteobacteria bacterium]
MSHRLTSAFILIAALAGCDDGGGKAPATSKSAAPKKAATATAKSSAAPKKRTETAIKLEPGKFHFDFPVVDKTEAKEGDKVFFVNMKLIRNELEKGKKPSGTQFLIGTMGKPGDKESIVKSATEDTVPNSGIVPIPAGQTAKVGDIVAGRWAVNLTRGYVTDASDPKKPKAIFIGLGYDNPAKAEDKKTGIGQYEYQLEENEFMVISKPYDPGTACAHKDGSKHKLFQVWRAEGDMVIGKEFTTFKAVKKADCKPIPLKPDYKVGDEVYVPWVGTMAKATITKVGKGRFGVKYESGSKDEKMISFGEVIDKLQ